MKTIGIMKSTLGRMQRELLVERTRLAAIHGNVYDAKKGGLMAAASENAADEHGMPMVRPGDASVAAPFTSRSPSVRHIVDLIRQGRCTAGTLMSDGGHFHIRLDTCQVYAALGIAAAADHDARVDHISLCASRPRLP